MSDPFDRRAADLLQMPATTTAAEVLVKAKKGDTLHFAGVTYTVRCVWVGCEWQAPGEVVLDLADEKGRHQRLEYRAGS